MDALEFLKEKKRMCNAFTEGHRNRNELLMYHGLEFESFVNKYPEEGVKLVEQWAKEHPRKTNLDKFEEIFGKITVCVAGDIVVKSADFWNQEYKERESEVN